MKKIFFIFLLLLNFFTITNKIFCMELDLVDQLTQLTLDEASNLGDIYDPETHTLKISRKYLNNKERIKALANLLLKNKNKEIKIKIRPKYQNLFFTLLTKEVSMQEDPNYIILDEQSYLNNKQTLGSKTRTIILQVEDKSIYLVPTTISKPIKSKKCSDKCKSYIKIIIIAVSLTYLVIGIISMLINVNNSLSTTVTPPTNNTQT